MRGWFGQGLPGGRVRVSGTVYFIRHGETDWNRERRYQGHADIPLNETGRAQAARNGDVLRAALGEPGRVAYFSSPLTRATETLEIVRERMALPRRRYRLDDRLIEIDLGDWNGRTHEEIAAEDPSVHVRREKAKWDFTVPGGESYRAAAARVREFLTELETPAVIVGHGATGRILRGYLLGLSVRTTPHLPAPQDVVFRLRQGREETL